MSITLIPTKPRQQPAFPLEPFEARMLEEYIAAHGMGDIRPEVMPFARLLYAEGDDYSTIAFEIVSRGLTEGLEPSCTTLPALAASA